MKNVEWFKCSVIYDKTMETGLIKKVTEVFMVSAVCYAEAEKKFVEEMTHYVQGGYEVKDIRRMNIETVVKSQDSDAETWYKAKVAYVTIDEKTGAEKRYGASVMVQAADFKDAVKNTEKYLSGGLGVTIIVAVTETNILDILGEK